MPNPVGINSYVVDFFSPNNLTQGVVHSINTIGGYQEFATISERNSIPLKASSASAYDGFTSSDDKWSSGRRRVGMMAYVIENQKLYTLQPVGYFGNGGELNETHWDSAGEAERAVRIDPANAYTAEGPNLGNGFTTVMEDAASLQISSDPNGCWVELVMGIDGNPISAVAHDANTGDLTITLTHDGSGSGTPIEFTVTLPTGYDGIYDPIVDDATVMPTDVGGIDGGTTAGDLSGLSMNQMWDKLLFPVVYPTGGGAGTLLNDTLGLVEAQEVLPSFTLTSTANMGTLSNPAGPWTGDVTGALVEELNGTGSGPFNPTVTPPNTINGLTFSYTAALGLNKWRLTTSFADGPMPVDSTGADYPGARYLAGVKTNTTDFEGVWPIYLGKADGSFEKRGLVSQSANDITCLQNYAEAPGIDHTILIPVDMIQGGDITIELYHPTLGNSPSYPTGPGGSSTVWVQTLVTMDVHANATGIQYYQYQKAGSTGGVNTWIINW